MTLSDLTGDDNTNLSPALRRARAAMTESSRQSPGMKIWIERSKALGFEFYLDSGSSSAVIFTSELESFLVHRVKTRWVKGGPNGGFPEHQYVSCSQFTISEDGSQWDSTKTPCLYCAVIGKPKAINVAKIYFRYDKPIQRKSGDPIVDGVKPLIVWQPEIVNTLLDSAASSVAGGSLLGCRFKVTRSTKDKSPRIGDSWVLNKKIDEQTLVTSKELAKYKAEADRIKFSTAFAPMSIEEQRAALTMHKAWSDRSGDDNGLGYDGEAFERFVTRRETPALSSETPAGGWAADTSLMDEVPEAGGLTEDIGASSEVPALDLGDEALVETPKQPAKPAPAASKPTTTEKPKSAPVTAATTDADIWEN